VIGEMHGIDLLVEGSRYNEGFGMDWIALLLQPPNSSSGGRRMFTSANE